MPGGRRVDRHLWWGLLQVAGHLIGPVLSGQVVRKSSVTDKVQSEVRRPDLASRSVRNPIRNQCRQASPTTASVILSDTVSESSEPQQDSTDAPECTRLTCADEANRTFRFRCWSCPDSRAISS
jgi:hypothetical protein